MRTLKYALLGLINRQPITGYDIVKEFGSNTLANFWHAKHSQVYPELKRLADEKMVTYEIVLQGQKLEKKLYTITEKGQKDFEAWLLQDEALEMTPKDVFRLRTYFTELMTAGEINCHLKKELDKHCVKRDGLRDVLNRTYTQPPGPQTREAGNYMVLLGAIMREDSYIQWLEYCIEFMTQPFPDGP